MTEASTKDILLTTLNAKYIHSALGLRYLYANMQELQDRCELLEFTIDKWPADIAEVILAKEPIIVGIGIYIWNRQQSLALIKLLKALKPNLFIVIGGPEVSHELDAETLNLVDYVISGPGDLAFYQLCRQIISKQRPFEKRIAVEQVPLAEVASPYAFYQQEDIDNRIIYVEASRGCPFKCEFCLSSLDKTAWPFDLDAFLTDMEMLYEKGVRHFKFVDRTFNLKVKTTTAILEFFLEKNDPSLFAHFELIPDHLPPALKDLILRFRPGSLQFEIGIQSFNPEVQKRISRRQDNEKTQANIHWLVENSPAHLHADLIFGLPGEDLASFAEGFNTLVGLKPHEIQVGILKRLKGTPITRHTDTYEMVYNSEPPFNILSTRDCSFQTIQRVNRFARYWDMFANSGRFKHSLPLLLTGNPFQRFMDFSLWLFDSTGQTHKISLLRQFDLLFEAFLQIFAEKKEDVIPLLLADFELCGLKSVPKALREHIQHKPKMKPAAFSHLPPRQARHQ